MPYVFPDETILRAFGLIFDGVSAANAAQLMEENAIEDKSPSKRTIEEWARNGEMPGGVKLGISWYQIRDICTPLRGQAITSDIVRKTVKTQYKDWAEQTMADLETIQDVVMDHIGEMKFSVRDIKTIAETRNLLEGKATERIEMTETNVRILGAIINRAGSYITGHYRDDTVSQAFQHFIDLVATEFENYLAFGGDPNTYEIGIKTTSNLSLPNGSGRDEEA